MININGIYFDKIKTAKVVQQCIPEEREFCRGLMRFVTTKWKEYWDVEINGEYINKSFETKEEAEKYLANIVKGM